LLLQIAMTVTFDPAKNATNIAERGLPFDMVDDIDWDEAIIDEDTRKSYGERRYCVLAMLGDRLHAAVITPRPGGVHVISFRKANRREVAKYAKIKEKA